MDDKVNFIKKLESIRNLPTLPKVIQELGSAIRDPKSDANRISKIIEDDPAIMARVLKVVNSVFYAAAEPVTSVQLAVARIGMRALNNIAMSTAVFSSFGPSDSSAFDREAFWKHSICTGIAASVLYSKVSQNMASRFSTDQLHLAGLLHDMGKIIFDQFFHDDFAKALEISSTRKITLLEAETEVFGTDHSTTGEWLGKKWNLDSNLLQVIQHHHDPDQADEEYWDLAALVHTANYICNNENLGAGGDGAPTFIQAIWKKLGLGIADIPEIVDEVNEESKESEILMSFV